MCLCAPVAFATGKQKAAFFLPLHPRVLAGGIACDGSSIPIWSQYTRGVQMAKNGPNLPTSTIRMIHRRRERDVNVCIDLHISKYLHILFPRPPCSNMPHSKKSSNMLS